MNVPQYVLDYVDDPKIINSLKRRIRKALQKEKNPGLLPFVLKYPEFTTSLHNCELMRDVWSKFIESQAYAISGLTTGLSPFSDGQSGESVSDVVFTTSPEGYHDLKSFLLTWEARVEQYLLTRAPIDTGGRILALCVSPDQKTCTRCFIIDILGLANPVVVEHRGNCAHEASVALSCRVYCTGSTKAFGQMLLTVSELDVR